MNNKNLLIAAILIVIIAAAVLFFNSQNKKVGETQNLSEQSSSIDGDAGPEETVETIDLTAVGEYTGSGTANRDYNGKTFVHLVVAQIPDPASGKFYEGWLVNMALDPPFFSTGKLDRENGVDFVLLYTSETDYSNYNQVVITEETESLGLDGKPETHVLEGSFE